MATGDHDYTMRSRVCNCAAPYFNPDACKNCNVGQYDFKPKDPTKIIPVPSWNSLTEEDVRRIVREALGGHDTLKDLIKEILKEMREEENA